MCDGPLKAMNDRENSASQYRARAQQLRMLAEQVDDPESRKLLLTVAGEYEELAEQAGRG
ncbi:MAG TPA: hypothetical protein VFW28_14735 [Micropepsaceae bacterium]|nr:hypothetical protein [Micropepsaceae bacterium]